MLVSLAGALDIYIQRIALRRSWLIRGVNEQLSRWKFLHQDTRGHHEAYTSACLAGLASEDRTGLYRSTWQLQ